MTAAAPYTGFHADDLSLIRSGEWPDADSPTQYQQEQEWWLATVDALVAERDELRAAAEQSRSVTNFLDTMRANAELGESNVTLRVEALERRQRIDAEKYLLSLEQYLALEGAFKALERELAENAATTQLFIASVVRAAECEDGMVVDAIAGLRQDRDTALTELDTTRRLLEQVDACHGKPLDDVILPLNDAMHAVHAFLAPAADEEAP